ncbi:tetratricopeptide repeat protein [Photobacterium japonica]|uniref:tetratricopeptide repeat protein n=1 Tax=Photobacterium japonica TaxID=2910235 RepID=UPI003D117E8F
MNKSIKVIASALCVALSLTGCASSTAPADDPIAAMAKVNNYQGMIAYYKAALQQQPDDPELLQKLAQVYYHAGDIESAAFYVEHLQSQVAPTPALSVLAGNIDDARGNLTGALSAYEQAATLGDTSATLNMSQGIVLGKLGRFQQAEDQFNQARLKGFDDIAIKNNLAVLYLAQGQFQHVVDMLIPVYTGADFKAKDNQTLAVNLAIALIKQGDEQQAYNVLKDMYTDDQLRVLFQQVKAMTVTSERPVLPDSQGAQHERP